jgi:hypothetical protein
LGAKVVEKTPLDDWLEISLIALLIIASWIAIMLLVSAGAGWRRLADFYSADRPFEGKKFFLQSARLRYRMSYNNILTIGANPEGIHVSVFFPFTVGHPTLFVPWEEVSAEAKHVWWIGIVLLQFSRCPSIPFWISRRLADKLVQASGVQFIKEEDI